MGAVSRMSAAVGALVVLLAVVVQALTESTLVADACYLGVLVAASAYAWIGVARWPRGRRLMPRLIAAGVTLNAIGELVWSGLVRAGADPDVSAADLAWFASYVCLCAALWVVLSRSREGGRVDLGFVVDAVSIVLISVLVFWRLTVEAIVDDTTVSMLVRVVWSAYPVMDAVLLALVLRVLVSRSARAAIDGWFAMGVCLWLTADVLYIHLPDDPSALVVMNSAWMVAPVLMARAAWRVRDVGPESAVGSTTMGGWVTQLLIAVCPLLVPPLLELVADLRGQPDRPAQLLIGMTLVIVLALVRTSRLILSEQRMHRELEVARDAAMAASEAAMAASEAKSLFLATMSHEIRTPLTTMLVSAGLLGRTPLNEMQQNLTGRMDRSGERLRSLVDGLLDFSRIEAGTVVLERADLDLPALVADIVDTHAARATAQGTELHCRIDPRVPLHVVGDRGRIFQVVSNLVDNALKFTEQGHVRLDVCAEPDERDPARHRVRFSVTDTGIGIHEEDRASVFESFSQVDPTAARRYEGAGLGLAICKELTELMGGSITVQSEPGVGSTFTVLLPLDLASSHAGADDPRRLAPLEPVQ